MRMRASPPVLSWPDRPGATFEERPGRTKWLPYGTRAGHLSSHGAQLVARACEYHDGGELSTSATGSKARSPEAKRST